MKNKIIRAISAVMAFSVVLGAYGCKKTEKPDDDVSRPDHIATSVFEYTSRDANNKEVNTTGVIEYDDRGNYNIVQSGDTLKDVLSSNEGAADKLKDKNENYNISDKEMDKIIDKAEDWVTFEYAYIVVNTTPDRILFDRLSHKNVKGIVLNDYASVGAEICIGSAQSAFIVMEGMYDKSKYGDELDVEKALKKMNINVVYITVESNDQTLSDFDDPQFKEMPLILK